MKFAKKYMLVSVDENGMSKIQKGNGVSLATEFDPGELPDLREARQERNDMTENLRDPNVSLYDKLARHSEHMTKYLAHMENLKKPQQELLAAIRGLSGTVPGRPAAQRLAEPAVADILPGEDVLSPRVPQSVEKEVSRLVDTMRTSGFEIGTDGSIRKGGFYAEPRTARKLLVAASTPARQAPGITTTELKPFTAQLRKQLVPYARSAASTRRNLATRKEVKKPGGPWPQWSPVR
jgi:hypothetical protein